MKNSLKKNRIKMRSLDNKDVHRIKKGLKKNRKFNNTSIHTKSQLKRSKKNIINTDKEDEISILSNANLNIIKILNNCANEDILNDSSFIYFNNDNISLDKINKDNSKNKFSKCNNINNNKIVELNSNISELSHESLNNEKQKILSSLDSKIKIKQKEKEKNNSFILYHKCNSNKETRIKRGKDVTRKYSDNNTYYKFNSIEDLSIKNIVKNNSNSNSFVYKKTSSFVNRINKNNLNKSSNNLKKTSIGSSKFNIDLNLTLLNRSKEIKNKDMETTCIGYLNEMEILKINENIQNDVNFIQLKKKISKLKKTIKMKRKSKCLSKENSDDNKEKNSNTKKSNKNINELAGKRNMNFSIEKRIKDKKEKFRILEKRKSVYDSFDDEEYKEEEIDYYLPPDSWYIMLFDSLLFLSSLAYLIFFPFLLSKNYLIFENNKLCESIFITIDIIYIIDIIINFFRAYQNFDERLIRKTKKIIFHYLKTWFILDLIQAIPFFSIFKLLNDSYHNNLFFYLINKYNLINQYLYLILLIKLIKLYKMLNDNSTINYFSEELSKSEIIDNNGNILINFFLIMCFLNLAACLFMFFGKNSYPSWIIKLNIQDKSYMYKHLSSLYFIIVTITTVGYGDITGGTLPEILFQLLLLIIGTIAYSFIISYISNYIIKKNKKSMTFEKNLEILHEIKIHHPSMSPSIYYEVLRNIYNEQYYERKDKHLLFDCLPYSLKNKLIMEMYKPIIKNFVFFKDNDNSDFVVKVVSSLKPLISIKGDILIEEGDYIKEIIFVKKGIIGLSILIDLEDPAYSLKKYGFGNEIGKFDIRYAKSKIVNHQRKDAKINLEDHTLNSLYNNKKKKKQKIKKKNNIEEIKIIEIRSNEHFGDALMFLNERCPLVAKVKTKSAEILILRKMEAIEIYSIYPNIWKRINKKSLFNLEQIHHKIRKKVIELSKKYKVHIKNNKTIKRNKHSGKHNKTLDMQNKNQKDIIETDKKENNHNIEDKQNIIKDNILEFNEKINDNNLSINMNSIDNVTFLKQKTTNKESLVSINIPKICIENENKSPINNLFLGKTFNKINSNDQLIKCRTTNDLNNQINIKPQSIESQNSNPDYKYKINLNNSQNEKKIMNDTLKQSTIYQNFNFSEDSNRINESINSKNSIYQKVNNANGNSLIKKEKIYYNAFINLIITKEKYFNLNSSYENINEISNNKYIKSSELQLKTKAFIKNECEKKRDITKKDNFLKVPGTTKCISSRKSFHKNNYGTIISEMQLGKNDLLGLEKLNNEPETFNKLMTIGFQHRSNNEEGSLTDFSQNKFVLSTNKLFEVKKIENHSTSKMLDINRSGLMLSPKKRRKTEKVKRDTIILNKKLNLITKNIQKTSKIINNPEEFYIDMFNNIIQKEKSNVKKEKEDEKSTILNGNSGERNNKNMISEKS